MDLADCESYGIMSDSSEVAAGVRMWEHGKGVVWEMSGNVLFAGKGFSTCHSHCSSEESLNLIDVSV